MNDAPTPLTSRGPATTAGRPRATNRRTLGPLPSSDGPAVDRTRQRIARDLHEHLGSGLASIAVRADLLAERELPAADARDIAGRLVTTAGELGEALSTIVRSLRGDAVRPGDLAFDLPSLVHDPCRATTTACRLHVSSAAADVVATANAARRRSGSQRRTRRGRRGDRNRRGHRRRRVLRRRGRAGSITPVRRAQDIGLRSMAHRTREAGGSIAIEAPAGRGTRLRATFPSCLAA